MKDQTDSPRKYIAKMDMEDSKYDKNMVLVQFKRLTKGKIYQEESFGTLRDDGGALHIIGSSSFQRRFEEINL